MPLLIGRLRALLAPHLAAQEDSLALTSVSALPAAEWDVAFEAWERAHPQR